MIGYGMAWLWKGYAPHKYPMNFLLINNVWTATFLIKLMNIIELYSWCSVQVENEGIQIVEKEIGSVWKMCKALARLSNLPMVRSMT